MPVIVLVVFCPSDHINTYNKCAKVISVMSTGNLLTKVLKQQIVKLFNLMIVLIQCESKKTVPLLFLL